MMILQQLNSKVEIVFFDMFLVNRFYCTSTTWKLISRGFQYVSTIKVHVQVKIIKNKFLTLPTAFEGECRNIIKRREHLKLSYLAT